MTRSPQAQSSAEKTQKKKRRMPLLFATGEFRSPERVNFCLHRKSPKMPQRGCPFGIPADRLRASAALLGAGATIPCAPFSAVAPAVKNTALSISGSAPRWVVFRRSCKAAPAEGGVQTMQICRAERDCTQSPINRQGARGLPTRIFGDFSFVGEVTRPAGRSTPPF